MKKLLLLAVLFSSPAYAACENSLPYGQPATHNTTNICHQGYYTAYDANNKVPVFVSWNLTADHARGCNSRLGSFTRDPMAAGKDVPPSAYDGSGYDRGHLADANDFNYDPAQERQSFYMTNMTPQDPGLNRGPWKWVEQASRAWAVDEHSVTIYAGSVIKSNDPKLSSYNIDVPQYFWKVVIDSNNRDAIAFLMPNRKFSSTQVAATITTIAQIEQLVGYSIPVPPAVDKTHRANLDDWYVDNKAFADNKELFCSAR